ncbi:aldehyde dehydrogenase family protein [Ancylobacter sp. MQZ15Z-1]|uniref:Aldehyde dehydrogenase family protein n=1 Tax=Ancylobacter mangrovi TaxID=2972472 RepID=A0A9X2PEP4_9HYPH|nr:aldehyde dehydrogenase family protein [Ancylobacter mangrovi]MCS0496540.1 aldehyde dehydrogenase family protein [Ancylobacter mangrovi]
MTIHPFMIANGWRTGAGEAFSSIDPSTGREVARIGGAGAADVDDAVAAARAALADPAWSGLKCHERAAYLFRIAELMGGRLDELARVQMEDNGKTFAECRSQAASAAATFRYYGAVCETFESEMNTQRGPSVTMTVYEPVGVVAAITPWNSPLTLEAQKLAPILAAGNTVVLKPSEVTPRVALEYARLAIEAGLPAGVVNVVTGAADVGRALVDHPDIDMVSFTGGTASGRAIAKACGTRLRPVVLELGGKSPHVVFADADLERARTTVASGIFSGGGQSCVAGSRIFVEASIHDAFLEAICASTQAYSMGPPEDAAATLGPMVSFQHRDHVASAVEAARAEGGKVLTGGAIPTEGALGAGAYYPATVIAGLGNEARVAQQEIFGPVAVVLPFRDEADLVAQANDTEFGLAAGIWTRDFAKAWRVARAIRAGTVWINTYKETSISTPFGGFKQSGLGREKGQTGMRTYMEPKGLYWHVG